MSSTSDTAAWLAPSRGMAGFHNHFKHSFDENYRLADGTFHVQGMSLAGFLHRARGLSRSLDGHHRIEEAHIFPLLAAKNPAFRSDRGHVAAHRDISSGLERYNKYIEIAIKDNSLYNSIQFRAIMDSFRKVLFDHLDQEVRDLSPESLKANGFTLDEVRRLPF